MNEKLNFGDIRSDLIENQKTNDYNKKSERLWSQYNSSLLEIGSTFYDVLPEKYIAPLKNKIYVENTEFGEAFKKYIEDELSKKTTKTAIEFGGPGSNFFNGFSNGFFKKTVGVCLDDVRTEDIECLDNNYGHSVVSGNVLDVNNIQLFSEIISNLGTNKADLLISRMQGALKEIRKNPVILDRVVRKWYSMLNKNGIMFIQFEYLDQHNPTTKQKYEAEINPPPIKTTEKYVRQWVEAIHKKYPEIEIQLGRGVVRLVKKENAPEELISSKELFMKTEN